MSGRVEVRFYCSYCDGFSALLICPKCEHKCSPFRADETKERQPNPLGGWKLEPECIDAQTPLECAAFSIAISLKRIADQLLEIRAKPAMEIAS